MSVIESVVKDQKNYFYSGVTRSAKFRKQQLRTLKRAIQNHEQQLHEAMKADFQKPEFESFVSETGYLLRDIDHTLNHLDDWMKPEKKSSSLLSAPSKSYVMREPYGVSLIIAPWNYPVQLGLAPAIGAIAAGNTIVLKPSEMTPNTSRALEKMIDEFFDRQFFTVVQGAVDETNELLAQPIDKIFFTGSPAVGKIIMKAAAENLTPLTLELGGKSPAIVDETASIKTAAKRIASGKFFNAGQTCVAPDYILVHDSVSRKLIEELEKAIHSFFGQSPKDSPDLARIVNEKHFDRLKAGLDGVKVLIGGGSDRDERYIEPTVVTDVPEDHMLWNDEIFGPILPIFTYSSIKEVVEIIRSKPKPLAYYHFTRDSKLKKELLEKLSFGGGTINDTLEHLIQPDLPFGGVGFSGMGNYHGEDSFLAFSHRKSILEKSDKVDVPLKYPPYKGKLKWLKRLFKWI
ncbi:aldehyde dehydrogenase [Salibacter halophilus]|uniref:Aldehyde dehydrogenase n=1 Tax=Salibacter halophilus TaxID=1803916 RepID=A0A6N6M826_9FLAO|nr:aldehyde dehydrogenase [Salibacter halophilus]KAB1063987.1 aldehyde dehydrogenase [Salibacter halophilus]